MGTQLPKKGGTAPKFLACVCCDQTAGWIKIPLGTEVCLGAGHIVLDVDPSPQRKGAQQPTTVRPMSIMAKWSPISAVAKLFLLFVSELVELLQDKV